MTAPIEAPDECRSGVLNYRKQQAQAAVDNACQNHHAAGRRIEHLAKLLELAQLDKFRQWGHINTSRKSLAIAERELAEFEASLPPESDDDDGIDWPGG